jgi:hypothetical protein
MKYFIEGYKSKTDFFYEDTLILNDKKSYSSEKEAKEKVLEYFEKDKNLNLIVINKGLELGLKQGTRFFFRDKEGKFEEIDYWWK